MRQGVAVASFSIGEAIGAPFSVLRRKPLIILAWGFAYMVLAFGPSLLLGSAMIPGIVGMAQSGDEPDAAAMAALMGPAMAMYPLLFLTTIAAQAVLMGAAYRSVLEPEASRFAYLRLSSQELWLGLVNTVVAIVLGLSAGVLVVVLALIGGVGAAVAGGAESMGSGLALTLVGLVLAGIGILVWVALRLSMATPMTFVDRTFRLFESWSLTRGAALRLFGLFLLVGVLALLLVIGVELLVLAIGGVAIGGLIGSDLQALEHLDFAALGGAIIGAFLLGTLLFAAILGFVSLLSYAPLAAVYRQLKGPDAETFA
ncbi:MAG: hypothetical protein ABW042_11975 [Phenylobacterium sp.]